MASCEHNNTIPDAVIGLIPGSQGGTGRHKCVVCAYAGGVAASRRVASIALIPGTEVCNHGRQAPTQLLAGLTHSQAGAARHKCATCAFQCGFEAENQELSYAEVQAHANAATEDATHGSVEVAAVVEGGEALRLSRSYERSSRNRAIAVRVHGTTCVACGFNFGAFYGAEHARSYIEIHHLDPLAQRGARVIDPLIDLRPLCANCHSMVHRNPARVLPIEELRALIQRERG